MNQRWLIAVVAAALILLYLLLGRDSPTSSSDSTAREASTQSTPPRPSDPTEIERTPTTGTSDDLEALPPPHVSPPIDKPASAADGAFEITVTAGGAPVGGAKIVLYFRGARDPNSGSFDWRRAASAVTDRTGVVRVFAAPGRYMVSVRHDAHAAALLDATRLAADPVTRVAVSLQAPVEITGDTVRAIDGAAIGYVDVTLRTTPWAPKDELVRVRSDAAGKFVIKAVAPGNYGLEAYKAGEGRARSGVNAPSEERVRLSLRAPGFLSGHVRTAGGKDAVGALVIAIGGRGQPASVSAGKSGAFVVEVDPGSYTLQATLGGETGATNDLVRAIAGETTDDIEITLAAGAAIAGTVVDAANAMPVSNATIDVSPHGFNGDSGRATSGGDGRFMVTPLAPGAFDVVVRAAGFVELERRGVSVGPSERFESKFSLQKPGSIAGFVHDEAKQPIEGARVEARINRGSAEARTDAQGRFVLDDIPPGEHVFVTARRDGERIDARANTTVRGGERSEVDLEIASAGTIEIEVVDAEGRAPKAGLLRVDGEARGARFRKNLDGSTLYSFAVPAGVYRARVEPNNASALTGKSEPVKLVAGATMRARVVVSSEGVDTALVTVLDVDGLPVAFARCTLRNADDLRTRDWTITDTEGRCRLSLDRSKPAVITAMVDHKSSLAVAAAKELALTLRPPGALRISVEGVPANETIRVIIDADGDFLEREVASTPFVITSIAPDDDAGVTVTTSSGRHGTARARIEPGRTNEVSVRVVE